MFGSELYNLIPPEIKNDEFYYLIQKLAKEEEIKTVLEIGSSAGDGSTEALVSGLRENPNKPTLFCIEISRFRFAKLQERYANHPFVKCYNVSSISLDKFPSEDEVIQFYKSTKTALNKYPLDTVLGWLRRDIEYLKNSGVPDNGIKRIKKENNITNFDMVLIDGSAFTGTAELDEIYGANFILLDDINSIKNYENYKRLSNDPLYSLVAENWALRNGYAIFRKTTVRPNSYISIKRAVESIEGLLVPGQEEFLFNKVKSLPEDAVIVEIGSYKGRSTVAMGYACIGTNRKIYCIDTWDGNDSDFSERNFFDEWRYNIDKNGLAQYVIPLKGYSDEVLSRWDEIAGKKKIDFIFIDGSHQYLDVLKDFEMAYPLVKEGGWIAFHGVAHTWPGPEHVWHDIAKHVLQNHEYSSTLACGQKPHTKSLSYKHLPVHFFTIVLNGEPFIRHHIEVFKRLPFKWHWHIIEGVAAFKHDTAWSLKYGGRITNELHDNGLSNDGTAEYLDELKRQFPDNVTIYRKPRGVFWEGKLEMVNAPLANIHEECLLWQIDVDELWTLEQICAARRMFLDNPEKTAAYYYCHYFVGEALVTTTRDTYGNYTDYEWLRTWRFKPGYKWISHEPPRLCKQTEEGKWVDIATINPFRHAETEKRNLVFQHYAYVIEKQLRFKEIYYGYSDAVKQWKKLQAQTRFPVWLRDYFEWVTDAAIVNTARSQKIMPIMYRDNQGQWNFRYTLLPSQQLSISIKGNVLTVQMISGLKKTAPLKNRKMKNILVISHERSGTHFLINAIAFNFPYYSNNELGVIGSSEELEKIFSTYYAVEEKRIFKSHHQFEFFRSFFHELLQHFHVFYIVRDGRDVLNSCFHYFNKHPDIFPQAKSIREFLTMNAYQDYCKVSPSNMVERWVMHVKGWLEQKDNVNIIYYEDLFYNFEETIANIANALNLAPPDRITVPTLQDRSIDPRKGTVGDWKNHFTEEDLRIFDSIASDLMKELGYYPSETLLKPSLQQTDKLRPNQGTYKKILWIRTDSIGDSVLANSMLPHIRKKYPDARIAVVCQNYLRELYEVSPVIDEVIAFDKKRAYEDDGYRDYLFLRLRRFGADIALNSVYSREPLTDLLTINSLAKERIGFEGDLCNIQAGIRERYNKFYTLLLPTDKEHKPELERHRDFLKGLGIVVSSLSPLIWITPEDEKFADDFFARNNLKPDRTIALFAGAQTPHRLYQKYGLALSRICKENNFVVIALGSASDYNINQQNLEAIGTRSLNLCGKTSLRQTAAILKRCRLAVGAETGIAHIACAVGTPNVVLLGGGHFGRFMPYSHLTSVVCLPLECYGCNWRCLYEEAHCICDILPEVITEAVHQTLLHSSKKSRLFVQTCTVRNIKPRELQKEFLQHYLDMASVNIIEVEFPREAKSLNEKGEASFRQGDTEKAEKMFIKAIELVPSFATVHNNLGVLYQQKGEVGKALKHFTKALELDSNRRDIILNCGKILTMLGKKEDARKLYSVYLQKHPQDVEIYQLWKNLESKVMKPYKSKDNKVTTNRSEYLVSAIVSTYNAEKYIAGCLEDLENQTIADKLEIIVVDSGSEQNEGQIVREFQKHYDNIVYIRTAQRESVYAAWNRGIKAARGKYITNANTDDRHRSDAFEKMASILDQRPDIALVYANVWITETENETFEKNTRVGVYRWPDYDPLYLTYFCYIGPQPMWRKSLHEKYGYFDESFESAGDWEFWLRISETERFFHIDEVLGLYLKSPSSVEHRDPTLSRNEALRVYKRYSLRRMRLENKIFRELNRVQKLVKSGKIDEAEQIIKHLISTFPHHPKIRNNFACLLWLKGRGKEALEHLKFATNLSPDDAEIVWNYGQALLAYGYLEDAVSLYEAFLNRHPGNFRMKEKIKEKIMEIKSNY